MKPLGSKFCSKPLSDSITFSVDVLTMLVSLYLFTNCIDKGKGVVSGKPLKEKLIFFNS
jgi:hypothetical protein